MRGLGMLVNSCFPLREARVLKAHRYLVESVGTARKKMGRIYSVVGLSKINLFTANKAFFMFPELTGSLSNYSLLFIILICSQFMNVYVL